MQLLDTKTILARLMATENLTIEQRADATTACFDTENRVLVIPVLKQTLSSNLYDLFIGHEVGHALYTPNDKIKEVIGEKDMSASVLNVVEDARIERKIKNKYPGLRYNFVQGYKELLSMDFFNLSQLGDVDDLNFIDRVNLHFKGGVMLGITFTEEEKVLVKKVDSTETYEDVINVTREILAYMKKEQEREEQEKEEFGEDFDESGNPGENQDSSEFPTEKKESKESKEEDSEGTGKQKAEKAENTSEQSTEKNSEVQTPNGDEIKSLTDEASNKNQNMLFSNDNHKVSYVNIPDIDITKCIWDHKDLYAAYKIDNELNTVIDREGFLQIQRESNPVVSYLVKEFEMHKNAEQMKKVRISKTGDLNMNRIFAYNFSEDLFKKAAIMPEGKNHGLVMFVDWSGSMITNIGNTIKQLFNLVFFCRKVNIPFEVYAFTNNTMRKYGTEPVFQPYEPEYKNGDMYLGHNGFTLMNLLSSRMTTAEFNYAGAALTGVTGANDATADCKDYKGKGHPRMYSFMGMNYTPLNEAIMAAMNIIPDFREKNRLQVVNTVFLSDGVSDSIHNYVESGFGYDGQPFKALKVFENTGSKYGTTIIRDPKTRYEMKLEQDDKRSGRNSLLTQTLMLMLKKRTGCNTMGFYLLSVNDMRTQRVELFGHDNDVFEKNKVIFRKEKFLVHKSSGYDEYYLLNTKEMTIDDDEELEVDSTMKKASLVRAFAKYATGRVMNRTVLNKFIQLIK